MSGSWDIATATSVGTGVAKTQINGGNNLTKPTQAVNLIEVVPYTVSSGAYTAGQSVALTAEIDSYSTFFENDRKTPTGMAGYLRQNGFKRIFLTGIATEYCVGFSAIDGIEEGFEKAGFEISWANEIDSYACKTYRLNHPNHHLIEEDMHKLNPKKLKPVDVLVGGFPCQAFSVAGYRKGFKDPRGNLFYEIARFIDELKAKPKALMLENVKNLSGHDNGRTKKAIV